MIKRIVKLTFQPELVPQFLQVFEQSKASIRAFEGCLEMTLVSDVQQNGVLFTLSVWESEVALNAYRNSDLFKTTWAKTKVLFREKPEAWSVYVID